MRLLVIDGNSILNRAYYGVRPLSNRNGVFTNAIFGFLNIYLKEVSIVQPDGIAVAFDERTPTFRHKAVADYKANRKGMPDELAMQMPLLKQILHAMGIACVSVPGFEADDILGTLARTAQGENTCVIMTGDRDSLQLLTEQVSVHLVTNRETVTYTPEKFRAEYGFAPASLVDLKALMGDSSDHIAGVKGIGRKTAERLVQNYQHIEHIYAQLECLDESPRVKNLLAAGKESAMQSRWLAEIVTNAPVPCQIEAYLPGKQDTRKLRELLTELELFRLLERLHLHPLDTEPTPAALPEHAPAVQQKILPDWQAFKAAATAAGTPVCYQFQDEVLTMYCQPDMLYETRSQAEILAFFASDLQKITDDAKPHYRYALAHGVQLQGIVADVSVMGYLLNPAGTDYQVQALCLQLHVPYPEQPDAYAAVQALPGIYEAGIARLQAEHLWQLWTEIELPLISVLASMEHVGVLVDTAGIRAFGETLSGYITETAQKIYDCAGEVFNIASPRQLGTVLFEKLHLPVIKKTKTGYSTSADVLEQLLPQHEIIAHILEYRQYTKLQSTYVDGLLKTVSSDGRIHTNYKQTETRTGRISSTEPNLQNIPVRTKLGRQMRKFFRAAEGNILLDADYSQIELRLMAHLSGDAAMQAAFRSGFDIHTATAATIFHVPEILVEPDMRSTAKTINFGILYGMGAFSLSKDLHISKEAAAAYIQDYLGSYPRVSVFLENIVREARETGYVCTMFQRRRYVPELTASNKQVQAAGRRIAMNTPVQGTAADIIKLAMIRVHQRLAAEIPAAKLLLQVHDELIVEVSLAEADRAAEILQEEMTHAVELSVPLLAEVNRGKTWYEAKG